MRASGSWHEDLMSQAIVLDGDAYRHLLAGRVERARRSLADAAALYRGSWEAAPPRSFGRLVACLKSAIIAGDAAEAATYVRARLAAAGGGELGCDSPTSCYALAVAALAQGEDELAERAAQGMHAGDAAFGRAADAIAALARGELDAYRDVLTAIVRDFEGREAHLTGVPIADTALMLEALAEPRGMAVRPASPLMPAV